MSVRIITGSAIDVLKTLPSESVQLVCTSPPYFGLRAYGTHPQVWGGDPEHGHTWQAHAHRQNNRHAPALKEIGREDGVGSQLNPKDWNAYSDFCPCGSWRGELGSEPTPALFIEHLLTIFDEIHRVLRSDGLAFVNLGDSYSGSGKGGNVGPNSVLGGAKQAPERRQGFTGGRSLTFGRYRLRADLTPEQVFYVLSELVKANAISDATQEGRE